VEALPLGLKWLGCEANHLPSSGAKVKNEWSYSPLPYVLSCHMQGQLYLNPVYPMNCSNYTKMAVIHKVSCWKQLMVEAVVVNNN